MELFVFFVLPLATILLSIVLQKILKNPILVAITIFALFLIVSFTAFSDALDLALIATIAYTIISFITAFLVRLFCVLKNRLGDLGDENDTLGISENNSNNECCSENSQVTLSANFIPSNNGDRTGRIRGCWRRR